MKALTFQQPMASLVASGVADMDNRGWSTEYRGLVLIVASARRVPQDVEAEMFVEQAMMINTAQAFGVVDEYDDMPRSAIIGYAELYDVREYIDGESEVGLWADGRRYQFMFRGARLFTEPIRGVRAKRMIYDYDELSVDALPASYAPTWRSVTLKDYTATIPLSETRLAEVEEILESGSNVAFCLDFVRGIADPLVKIEGENVYVRPLQRLVLATEERRASFRVVGQSIGYRQDDEGEPLRMASLTTDEEAQWPEITYVLAR